MSGKANIQKNLQELGLTLNDDEIRKVTERIIALGDKKERVTKDDLPFIISDVLDTHNHKQKVFVNSYVLTHAKGLMPQRPSRSPYMARPMRAMRREMGNMTPL